MSRIELTILMPCLNEERTLGACIDEANEFIRRNNLSAEVLIADNGSIDRSREIALEKGARVVPVAEKGYGNALKGGIADAKGKYTIMGDCDCSYDFLNMEEMLSKLREGYQLVMGDRFKGGIQKGAMSWSHKLGVPVLSFIARVAFRTNIGDFHCGMRGFDTNAMRNVGLASGGMEFATEMIAKAVRAKFTVAQVPVPLRPDKRDRKPHLRTVRDGFRHLFLIFKLAMEKSESVKVPVKK